MANATPKENKMILLKEFTFGFLFCIVVYGFFKACDKNLPIIYMVGGAIPDYLYKRAPVFFVKMLIRGLLGGMAMPVIATTLRTLKKINKIR